MSRLRQLLHNLTKNAIEAMQDGKGTQVTVATRPIRDADGETIELTFTDDGPGFPEQDIGDIFEPYVTTKPKGSGLGLAIVKKIVEEHGGQIRLESCSSGGARVIIRFPACRPLSKSATANLSSHEETG